MSLTMILVFLAIWTLTLTVPGTIALTMAGGLRAGFGNRDHLPELAPWGARAVRAHRNMVENLPVFVALIVAAHLSEAPPVQTLLGANLFLWGRVAHGVIYIAGVPYLRTAAFIVSIAGLLNIAAGILKVVG